MVVSLCLGLRDEFLNGEIFYSLKEVQVLAERWRVYYNTVSHAAVAGLQAAGDGCMADQRFPGAAAADTHVERLQCYRGVTEEKAIGQFDEGLQRLYMEFSEGQHESWQAVQGNLKGRDFFRPGQLMRVLECERPCVLLIDELDKVDDGFEPMLLDRAAKCIGTRGEGAQHVRYESGSRTNAPLARVSLVRESSCGPEKGSCQVWTDVRS